MSEVTLTRLSSKGQVVIPKSLRDIMGLEDGDVFAMYGEEEFIRLLEWGESFAKKITRKEVTKAIEEYRKGQNTIK